MALSDKFINIAEDGLQSAKSALDKFTGIFSGDKKQTATSAKTEQNLTVSQAEPSNLNAQNAQNLMPSIGAIKEANLTAQSAQTPAKTVSNLDKNGSLASNLTPSAPSKTNKSAFFDIELNENLGVILIGDSIMQGFGWGFENALKTSKISIKNMAKASTGLTNKKFYDWSEELKAALASLENRPQNLLIFALFGANDAYSYTFDEQALDFGTDAWREAYEGRIAEIYEIATEHGAQVVWLGVPCMKSEKFDKKMKALNLIYKDAAQKYGARYIDISGAICDNGKYLKEGADKKPLRKDDGMHISMNGAKKIAVYVVDKLLNGQSDNF